MLFMLISFLIFWNRVECDGYRVYRDDRFVSSVHDTCINDSPGFGSFVYTVTAFNQKGESGFTESVTGVYIDAARPFDIAFTGTLEKGDRFISLIRLPSPDTAWIFGNGFVICRADYNGDDSVTLSDLVWFGMYSRAESFQADLNGDGLIDLSDFAAFGNLYQWFKND